MEEEHVKETKWRRAKKCQNPLRPNCSNPAFVYVDYKGRMIIPVCQRCEKELTELDLDRFNALRLRPLLLRDAEKVVEEANRKFGTHFTIIGGLAERGFTFHDVDVAGEDKYVLPKEINAAIYISQKLKIHMDIIPYSLGGIWHVNWHTRRIRRHEFDFDPLECKPYWCNLFHRSVSLFDCDACPKGDGPCPFWTERVVRREGAIKNGKSTQGAEADCIVLSAEKERGIPQDESTPRAQKRGMNREAAGKASPAYYRHTGDPHGVEQEENTSPLPIGPKRPGADI